MDSKPILIPNPPLEGSWKSPK